MQKEDIVHLARLARIKVRDTEVATLQQNIESILDYVSIVNEITAEGELTKKPGVVRNVLRDDSVTNEPGEYTEDLLNELPSRDGNYMKVKKILSTD